MTIWRAPALVGFVEAAGFRGGDRAVAVAVALAASHGDDAFLSTGWAGSEIVSVGLWQVGADRGDTRTVAALLDPLRNAEAARQSFLDTDRSWSWCVGWQSGRWRLHLADAREAVAHPARADTVVPFGTIET